MGHNRAKLAGEAVTLVVQEAEFYGADSGPQDHAAWRHNDPLLIPVLLEYLERRSACLLTVVLNRLDDIVKYGTTDEGGIRIRAQRLPRCGGEEPCGYCRAS